MTIRLPRALIAPLLALFCLAAAAQVPQAPEIAARSYLLVDVTSNQVLASKEVDTQVEPASLTKLMTAYLVFDARRCRSASAPGRWKARACSSIPRCRSRWRTSSRA
jgi:D-alanyl-D-alanine carboxypeptidase